MTVSLEVKKEFLADLQKKIIQGRRLLSNANHRWADKLLNDLYFDIEKADWIDVQKKNQLIMIIVNSWHIYINSLIKRDKGEIIIDKIRYLDAYNRFFTFLSKLDDFYHFSLFINRLLKTFIDKEDLSQEGITKFLNSYCAKVYKREEFLELIELQILLMHLRKSVLPTDMFLFSMEYLSDIVLNLKPDQRSIFLNIFLENINIKHNLMDSQEFVKNINMLLVNRLPSSLKSEFGKLGRISINQRTFPTILPELEEIIYYLNDIGEHSWIIMVIRFIYSKIEEYQSFPDAINYIRKFVDFSISRSRFEIAFKIYDFIEDLFMYKSDLGYSNILVELWVEACKKFLDVDEKRYLLQSIVKLGNHLKIPRTNDQIFHFFYTSNYLWQFKSRFFSVEQRDFWRMLFYRALFEEKNINLATKLIPHLDNNLQPLINDLSILTEHCEPLKAQIYSFHDDLNRIDPNIKIKKFILRITSEGLISYKILSAKGNEFGGKLTNEYWNDAQIGELYDDYFSSENKIYNFNLEEMGKIFYLFLPKVIRDLFSQFQEANESYCPHLFLVLDNITIPFELVYDNCLFLLKTSISYRIGNPGLNGITFKEIEGQAPPYNALIIESTNATFPIKWNEEKQSKELLFPYIGGQDEVNEIIDTFKNMDKVNSMSILTGAKTTREMILSEISKGNYHIIHFIGNIFYSDSSPKDSYILTNDNQVVKLIEIANAITTNINKIKPFLFFNAQMYNSNGEKIENTIRTFGNIIKPFNYDQITGIMSRNYNISAVEIKEIITNFYINLLNQMEQGNALLNAISKNQSVKSIENEKLLPLTSFILFGDTWKIL